VEPEARENWVKLDLDSQNTKIEEKMMLATFKMTQTWQNCRKSGEE
jgi:hypothetical protein